jgi:hypothetical protein
MPVEFRAPGRNAGGARVGAACGDLSKQPESRSDGLGPLPGEDQSEWHIEWQAGACVSHSGAGGRTCQLAFSLVNGRDLGRCEVSDFHGKEKVYGSIP